MEAKHRIIRGKKGKVRYECFENDNVIVCQNMFDGRTIITLKDGADPKVKNMYVQLMESHK